jgi:hypothetical protein
MLNYLVNNVYIEIIIFMGLFIYVMQILSYTALIHTYVK